jgi:hypothetical protein
MNPQKYNASPKVNLSLSSGIGIPSLFSGAMISKRFVKEFMEEGDV